MRKRARRDTLETMFFLCVTASLLNIVECFSTGPPWQACQGLAPHPVVHGGERQITEAPYDVDLSDFRNDSGTLLYEQNRIYNCKEANYLL